jgi:hypothetical protein
MTTKDFADSPTPLTPAELAVCAARLREALAPSVSPAIRESLVMVMMSVLEEPEDE